jgi:hypothetical protein
MLSLKTTIAALVAALSVIATASVATAFVPQAFAQALVDEDDEGNTVTATQSNSATFDISQSQSQGAEDDAGLTTDGGRDNADNTQDQGFCLQVNQQNAAAGDDATNTGINAIVGNDEGSVDCS